MNRFVVPTLALVALLVLASGAGAEYAPEKPACPPDRVCTTATGNDAPPANRTRPDNASTPADAGANCMDGAQEGETCRDDVRYLGGGPRDATDEAQPSSDEGNAGEEADPVEVAARNVPRVGLAVILGGFAAMALFLGRHRERP